MPNTNSERAAAARAAAIAAVASRCVAGSIISFWLFIKYGEYREIQEFPNTKTRPAAEVPDAIKLLLASLCGG